MKKKIVSFLLFFLLFQNLYSQKSADDVPKTSDFEFKTVTDEKTGKVKYKHYTGFAVELIKPNYNAANNASKPTFSSSGFALNFEYYLPFSKKMAVSANVSYVFLKEIKNTEVNLGLYYMFFKGFYAKPQFGLGVYGSEDMYVKEYLGNMNNITVRGQIGYLFNLGKSYLDLGYALHNINHPNLKTVYNGLCIKYVF